MTGAERLDDAAIRRALGGSWRRPPIRPVMRMGLPKTGGAIVAAARHWPVLISAGAMWNAKRRRFVGPSPGILAIADVAIDSAGFTAQTHHGGYPWTVAEYVALVVLQRRLRLPPHRAGPPRRWTWWAQMDLCCEPEIANDRATALKRVEGTRTLLENCRDEAARWADRGEVQGWPMPVLQGWRPDDYERSAAGVDQVLDGRWPSLVGVGSVCRRDLGGSAGLEAILERLDRLLPPGVMVHTFGVKGDGLPLLRSCARVWSTDSLAWDFGVRRKGRAEGLRSTNERRIAAMRAWHDRSVDLRLAPAQTSLWMAG